MTAPRSGERPSYGIDAPGLVRGFFVGGASVLAAAVGLRMSRWTRGTWFVVGGPVLGLGAAYGVGMGGYMLYYSLIGKIRERHRLLDLVPWSGDETVLDVGCGRGLLLVAAAGRVPQGRAVGIDIWQAEDQSGNRPDAALANAQVEGVESRVAVQTADMRHLPFPDGSLIVQLKLTHFHGYLVVP